MQNCTGMRVRICTFTMCVCVFVCVCVRFHTLQKSSFAAGCVRCLPGRAVHVFASEVHPRCLGTASRIEYMNFIECQTPTIKSFQEHSRENSEVFEVVKINIKKLLNDQNVAIACEAKGVGSRDVCKLMQPHVDSCKGRQNYTREPKLIQTYKLCANYKIFVGARLASLRFASAN